MDGLLDINRCKEKGSSLWTGSGVKCGRNLNPGQIDSYAISLHLLAAIKSDFLEDFNGNDQATSQLP